MSRKRVLELEDLLSIKLADAAAPPLAADRIILANFSSCVRGLPADAVEWDLSQLVVEGHAVQRQVVVAWINAACQLTDDVVFEVQEQHPARYANGLVQLLGFADAVGTSRGLLRTLLPQTSGLQVEVQLQDDDRCVVDLALENRWNFNRQILLDFPTLLCVKTVTNKDQSQALEKLVADQLEALLFLAYKLELSDLQQQVVSAIRRNAVYPSSLLYYASIAIVSERIMQAMPGSSSRALANALIMEPCPFVAVDGLRQLLCPRGDDKPKLTFQADVLQDFLGFSPGEVLEVELDLLGQSVIKAKKLGGGVYAVARSVQLLLGTPQQWPF